MWALIKKIEQGKEYFINTDHIDMIDPISNYIFFQGEDSGMHINRQSMIDLLNQIKNQNVSHREYCESTLLDDIKSGKGLRPLNI